MSVIELFEDLVAAVREEQPALVVEVAARFLAHEPRNWYALQASGQALATLARYEDGERFLGQALDAANDRQRVLTERELGHLHQARGAVADAEHWFRQAIAHRPDDPIGYVYLGALLAVSGRLDEAEAIHRQGVRCTGGPVDEAWLNLGLVLRRKGQYPEALKCFRQALALDPTDEDARVSWPIRCYALRSLMILHSACR